MRTRWLVHEVTCLLVPEKGSIPLGWALTLFQVQNSQHVMEWSIWWRIDREKGPFAPTTCILFVLFHVLK